MQEKDNSYWFHKYKNSKMTKHVASTTILEVNGNKIVTSLLRKFKCVVIVFEPGNHFWNTPNSTRFFFSETHVKDTRYKTYMSTDHYLQQYNIAQFISNYFINILYASITIPEYIEDVAIDLKSGTYSLNGLMLG